MVVLPVSKLTGYDQRLIYVSMIAASSPSATSHKRSSEYPAYNDSIISPKESHVKAFLSAPLARIQHNLPLPFSFPKIDFWLASPPVSHCKGILLRGD